MNWHRRRPTTNTCAETNASQRFLAFRGSAADERTRILQLEVKFAGSALKRFNPNREDRFQALRRGVWPWTVQHHGLASRERVID